MYNFYLLRITINSSAGSATGQWISNADRKVAYANAIKAFFTMAGTAANSTYATDTVILLNDTGVPIKLQRFKHE